MFSRDYAANPYAMETVRPIEVPVIAQVKRRLSEGHYVEAITLAYHTALLDLQRAYRYQFPAHWTHLDVQQWARRNNLGLVADCIAKLYRMYEPVRYGRPSDISRGDVVSPLTSLYAQSPLWRLYAPPSFASPYGYANGSGNGGWDAYGNALGYPSSGGYGEGRGPPPS